MQSSAKATSVPRALARTAHRRHASTAVAADYFDADHKMLGYLMEKEVKAVDNILKDIRRPFTAIMGGSKVSTCRAVPEDGLGRNDCGSEEFAGFGTCVKAFPAFGNFHNLILCGGMTYTFAKAMGGNVGISICENDKLDLALDIMKWRRCAVPKASFTYTSA